MDDAAIVTRRQRGLKVLQKDHEALLHLLLEKFRLIMVFHIVIKLGHQVTMWL